MNPRIRSALNYALPIQLGVLLLAGVEPCWAQQFHEQRFEEKSTVLKLGLVDGQVKLLDHGFATSKDLVHNGRQAERVAVRIGSGSFCFLEYAIEPFLIFDEVKVSAWVNASRPGTRLAVRVVLPNAKDAGKDEPIVTLLRSEPCDVAGRWRSLVLTQLDELLKKQQQLLQAERKHSIDIRGAYVDMILFDIYSGIGDVEVRVDDLRVGPLVRNRKPANLPTTQVPINLRDEDGQMPIVDVPDVRSRDEMVTSQVVGDRLKVGGRPFFIQGIKKTDVPLKTIKEAGLNTVFADWPIDPALWEEADKLGLKVVPMLGKEGTRDRPLSSVSAQQLELVSAKALAVFAGSSLTLAQETSFTNLLEQLRQRGQRRRPVTGDVKDGYRPYSRHMDMVGVGRYPIFTSTDAESFFRYLVQRRGLARPGTLLWSWIQTHPPEEYAKLAYGHSSDEAFSVPIGPTAEQIRLMSYTAVAAGYRGIVFSSDRALSESGQGRERMLQLAMLNLEFALIEPFLANGKTPMVVKTSHPDVQAVVISHERGTLVIPFWKQRDTHFVVGQASINDLNVIVEGAPEAAQAFQISLGEVRGLKRSKDLGGVRIVIPEFDTVSLVVLTSDLQLFAHYQELIQRISPQASAWARELSDIQFTQTEAVSAKLESSGRGLRDGTSIFAEASRLQSDAAAALARRDFRQVVLLTERSRRVLRSIRSQLWREAQKQTPSPVSNPYGVSFFTLPEYYSFADQIKNLSFTDNRLPTGDFERDGYLDAVGWRYVPVAVEDFESTANLISALPKEGKRSLELKMTSRSAEAVSVVDGARVEMMTPAVPVRAGQTLKLSGYYRIPTNILGSVDGVMMFDSLGGETLALRQVQACDWRPFVLFRPVHQDSQVRLHLVLTGVGSAIFDDLKMELVDTPNLPLAGREPALAR